MATKNVPPRLFGILAREAKTAVLFRRGPSKWCQMILWHTDTDEIVRGQWVHHRIYERDCDLSPDGKLVVYHAFDGRKKDPGMWSGFTAVSRPPYFTALAIWKYHLPGGGGLFTANRDLLVFSNSPLTIEPPLHRSTRMSIVDGPAERLRQSGWECVKNLQEGIYSVERLWEKKHRRSKSVLVMRNTFGYITRTPGQGTKSDDFWIRRQVDGAETPLNNVDWADIDHKQRLIFTRQGQLYAAEILPDGLRETQLADFSEDQPTELPPPAWAKQWPKR